MSFHYLLEDGAGSLLLEDGSGFYQLENAPSNMPTLVGLEYAAAQLALQVAGIFVPASLGYFGTFPISIRWQRSAMPPSTVLGQAPTAGNYVAPNDPVVLTCAEFPVSVAFP